MRCKKHPADQSCSVGVCASCLRERLVAVIAAQTQAHALKHALQDCRKSDSQLPQPPLFPRSVSPYISRRKSENAPAAATCRTHGEHHLFYSTPQLGPHRSITVEIKKKSRNRFSSMFWGFFRSKPERKPDFGLDPVADPTVSVNSSSASPAWFPNIIRGRRKKKVSTFLIDESAFRTGNNRGRGMSPARNADQFDEHCDGVTSGYSSDSKGWRQTPRRTQTSARRGGGRAASHGRSLSSLTFCLSPLVRPSPNRHWNQKAAPPEAGDPRTTPKAHLSTAVSFCKNRSRKLADIGRYPNG
ncbi:hypothetical protein SASPL_102775 [Salvia splendens]|uniref:Uncharacterized protein n=1 Tax=Salvia splendens TaxID=180675 RepID=A0A8X8YUF0_SALSN|nr:uncharacterized protein LOC121791208 [Salvia splendens]KAG6437845.1 hypothetical protein SASPL_102775 [Salvia splendens]